VTEDQPLVEISTDKVDTEIPSPGAGRIAKIVAAEGETLPVGAMLAVIEQAGAEAAAKLKVVAPKAAPKPEVAPVQVMPEPVLPPALSPQPMQAAGAGLREAEPEVGGPRRFSPVVLKIAAEEGIDLSRVPGTGIGGGVCKRDLQRYLDSLRKGGVSGGAAAPPPTNGVAQSSSRPALAAAATTQPQPAQSGAVFRPPVYQPIEGDIVEP